MLFFVLCKYFRFSRVDRKFKWRHHYRWENLCFGCSLTMWQGNISPHKVPFGKPFYNMCKLNMWYCFINMTVNNVSRISVCKRSIVWKSVIYLLLLTSCRLFIDIRKKPLYHVNEKLYSNFICDKQCMYRKIQKCSTHMYFNFANYTIYNKTADWGHVGPIILWFHYLTFH